MDPSAVAALAARLPRGSALISATNGKTTTAAMAASILAPTARLARNAAGANLVSGVASTLVAARDAELGLFEVDEAALPEVVRRMSPRVIALGNLFRDQLDRYGELELVANRWRAMVAVLPEDTSLVVNADDPVVCGLTSGHDRTVLYGLDDSLAGAYGAATCGGFEVLRPLRSALHLRGRVRGSSWRLPV